jgi:molecular chaperone GrpE
MKNFIDRLMKKKQKIQDTIADTEPHSANTSEFDNKRFKDENQNQPEEFGVNDSLYDSNNNLNPSEDGPAYSAIGYAPDTEESSTEKLEQEVQELKDKYLRLFAEFDNFKKRTLKERSDLFKTAGKSVLMSLIPFLDDLERAQKSFAEAKEITPIKEGIALITSKFKNILIGQGLTEMKSIGEKFDTDLHEAITNIPAPNEEMKGKVIDEMEKGYLLNDKVVRFAKVIVGV